MGLGLASLQTLESGSEADLVALHKQVLTELPDPAKREQKIKEIFDKIPATTLSDERKAQILKALKDNPTDSDKFAADIIRLRAAAPQADPNKTPPVAPVAGAAGGAAGLGNGLMEKLLKAICKMLGINLDDDAPAAGVSTTGPGATTGNGKGGPPAKLPPDDDQGGPEPVAFTPDQFKATAGANAVVVPVDKTVGVLHIGDSQISLAGKYLAVVPQADGKYTVYAQDENSTDGTMGKWEGIDKADIAGLFESPSTSTDLMAIAKAQPAGAAAPLPADYVAPKTSVAPPLMA